MKKAALIVTIATQIFLLLPNVSWGEDGPLVQVNDLAVELSPRPMLYPDADEQDVRAFEERVRIWTNENQRRREVLRGQEMHFYADVEMDAENSSIYRISDPYIAIGDEYPAYRLSASDKDDPEVGSFICNLIGPLVSRNLIFQSMQWRHRQSATIALFQNGNALINEDRYHEDRVVENVNCADTGVLQ